MGILSLSVLFGTVIYSLSYPKSPAFIALATIAFASVARVSSRWPWRQI